MHQFLLQFALLKQSSNFIQSLMNEAQFWNLSISGRKDNKSKGQKTEKKKTSRSHEMLLL